MNFCTRCLYPASRPDVHFIDGLCSGCRSFDERKNLDWDILLGALRELIGAHKNIIVPVSGGKDSTYQVIKLQELGGNVLAVNASTDMLSDIGRRNLNNIGRLAPLVERGPSREVRRKLVRLGLFRVGDLSYPEHCAIWSIPTREAIERNIKLIVWGEQPQREYACPSGVVPATELNASWVAEFGGMLGMRIDDLIGEEGLTEEDVEILRFPSDIEKSGIKAIWLGDYIPWDGWKNAFIAQQYGFETLPFPVETSLANYENLDNHVTVLRDWLRFLKYGYSRATDIACNHIRRGRLTRDEAIALVERAEQFPKTSLGMPIADVLKEFDLSVEQFKAECAKWTNPDIFEFRGGKPVTDEDGTPCRLPHASYRHCSVEPVPLSKADIFKMTGLSVTFDRQQEYSNPARLTN